MKAVIMLITVVCGYCIGNMFASKLKMRRKFLEKMILLLDNFENLIRYKDMTVDELVKWAVKSNEYKELCFLQIIDEENGEFSEKWRDSLDNKQLKAFLSNEDINEISLIGVGLGKSDKQGQDAHLKLHKTLIKNKYETALKDEQSKGRLYKKLGLLSGIGLSIIIV